MNACVTLIFGVKSITFDNGKEFANHLQLKQHGMDAYFADLYSSNQRARNENTNGLIEHEEHCSARPKGTSFDKLSDHEIKRIQDTLHHQEIVAVAYTCSSLFWISICCTSVLNAPDLN